MTNEIKRKNIFLSDEEVEFHGDNFQTSQELKDGMTFDTYLEQALQTKLVQCNRASIQ